VVSDSVPWPPCLARDPSFRGLPRGLLGALGSVGAFFLSTGSGFVWAMFPSASQLSVDGMSDQTYLAVLGYVVVAHRSIAQTATQAGRAKTLDRLSSLAVRSTVRAGMDVGLAADNGLRNISMGTYKKVEERTIRVVALTGIEQRRVDEVVRRLLIWVVIRIVLHHMRVLMLELSRN
jgi:hypothetical protein